MYLLDIYHDRKYSVQYSGQINLDLTYNQYTKNDWEHYVVNKEFYYIPDYELKPKGLWYAFGRDWINFHESCEVDDSELPPVFELEVDTSNFIKLTNAEDIASFNDRYKIRNNSRDSINWLEVSKVYSGIEIYPFRRKNIDLLWYQVFDISSGCIWNLQTIKKIIRLN